MKVSSLILILTVVFGIATGQILFKLAALAMGRTNESAFLLSRLANPYLASALGIYCIATFIWVFVLRTTPLSVAYPFMALSFVIVPVLGAFFLGESLKSSQVFGGLLIILGICLVTR